MKLHHLERTINLPRTVAEIFSFFSDASNLELLTPSWLKFKILSPRPITMCVGTLIDYQISLRGLPIRWQSEIITWNPPHCFVDEQRRGPYRFWKHEHRFAEINDGTQVIDRVQYSVSFDWLSHRYFVRPNLERIFDFREQKMGELFSTHGRTTPPS